MVAPRTTVARQLGRFYRQHDSSRYWTWLRRANGITGRVLVLLDESEYTQDLGLTHLQAKSVMSHLR